MGKLPVRQQPMRLSVGTAENRDVFWGYVWDMHCDKSKERRMEDQTAQSFSFPLQCFMFKSKLDLSCLSLCFVMLCLRISAGNK
jgi:hypothetical protein